MLKWNHMIIVGTNDTIRDIDMYASVFSGRLPSANDYDMKADTSGSDWLNFNSDDEVFSN